MKRFLFVLLTILLMSPDYVQASTASTTGGTTSAVNPSDKYQKAVLGSGRAEAETPPPDGILVQGNAGIQAGPATGVKSGIDGPPKAAATSSDVCNASNIGAMHYNAAGNYMEICSYP